MRDCPVCQAAVDGLKCDKCGYAEPGASAVVDPTQWLCHYEERGQRCGNLGTFSQGTTGGGPWYCRQHIPGSRDAQGKRTPEGANRLASIVAGLRLQQRDAR